jgi:hypothetical protein
LGGNKIHSSLKEKWRKMNLPAALNLQLRLGHPLPRDLCC